MFRSTDWSLRPTGHMPRIILRLCGFLCLGRRGTKITVWPFNNCLLRGHLHVTSRFTCPYFTGKWNLIFFQGSVLGILGVAVLTRLHASQEFSGVIWKMDNLLWSTPKPLRSLENQPHFPAKSARTSKLRWQLGLIKPGRRCSKVRKRYFPLDNSIGLPG